MTYIMFYNVYNDKKWGLSDIMTQLSDHFMPSQEESWLNFIPY